SERLCSASDQVLQTHPHHPASPPFQPSPSLKERLRVFESLREKRGKKGVAEKPLSIQVVGRALSLQGHQVNGELWELERPLEADCELQLLGFDTVEGKQVINLISHYYSPLLRMLMKPMRKLLAVFAVKDSKLRLQLVEEEMSGSSVTVYRCGDSVSVCRGPLLPHTGFLKVFRMLQSSGLTRLMGVAFPAETDREAWEREQEAARRRDHRRIGMDQELFFFNEVSPGSCFFLPKGAHIYNTLMEFIKSEYRRRGFSEVVTPTLFSTALWERSGHWEHYGKNMFTVTSEGSLTHALKPMNCPAHCLMFEHRVRSWRELPLRWADFGALHRNELSGALGGLTRVRRFCQDDAHIFCAPEQLEEEIVACLDFVRSVYRVFGFSFHCLLSTRPTPCLGDPEQWDDAEQQLENSLQQFGERWELNPGDGAFYGPKIDILIKDAIGRQHQCATIQLDFQLPIRFDLQYLGRDGQKHRPVMIHRAVLGSLERMIAILAENFGGKWPLWLSPAQISVIPVGGSSESYGRQVAQQFCDAGFVVDLDVDPGATLNKKIRSAQLAQYNYIFVVGDKECESGTVSVRSRAGKQLGRRPTEEVLGSLQHLRNCRSNLDEF
uniref:threonine--tRNA ligase n=1 Tax=Nothobranchius furzeri TaxID=105023 RepID=A0A8C6PL31_NOTFU